MTTPAGTIGMSDVNVELSISSTATVGLNDTVVRELAEISSGQIAMSNLQSKTDVYPNNVNWNIVTNTSTQMVSDAQAVTGFTGTITISYSLDVVVDNFMNVNATVKKNGVTQSSTFTIVAGDTIQWSLLGTGPFGS